MAQRQASTEQHFVRLQVRFGFDVKVLHSQLTPMNGIPGITKDSLRMAEKPTQSMGDYFGVFR